MKNQTAPQFKSSDIITVTGMRGSGKSEWAKHYLRSYQGSFIIYDPNGEHQADFPKNTYVPAGDSQEEFELMAKAIWDRGNILFIVDEVEGILKERKPLPPYTGMIMRRGRHKNIGFMAITRRIADLSKTVVSLSNHIIAYHLFLPNDIKYLGEFMPNAERLMNLPEYHFIHYSQGKSTLYKPIKI